MLAWSEDDNGRQKTEIMVMTVMAGELLHGSPITTGSLR